MTHKFAEIAFTEKVRQVQSEMGSRTGYERMDGGPDYNYLFSEVEAEFITQRDSFYMATVSETGWPYVQHRGGPIGFVKVLDASTIGFADYAGNRQYISTGNLRGDGRISLFFMDYPNQRRLKIMGRVTVVAPDDLETLAKLEDDSFRAPIERAFLIHIEAFDWNCPKYITPRYTNADIKNLIAPLHAELEELRSGNTSVKTPVSTLKELGNGPLPLVITAIRQEADGVRSYELRRPDGMPVIPVEAGAHIQVPVMLQNGKQAWRFYSISSDPGQQKHYQIAVLDQPDGRGGSHGLHHHYQVGMLLNCYRPGNYFALQSKVHEKGQKAIFIAGGIGITPISSMLFAAKNSGYNFELHYAAKSCDKAAFIDNIEAHITTAHTYFSQENQRLNLKELFNSNEPGTIHYLCGPPAMLRAARAAALELRLPPSALVFETFEE